ncbi:DMT family transporter [Halomonas kashgarensis]|uniref:DMT family transporter n=1 Tax=Halomonas kashgarensis TaxID=3084920 RepID=UPI003A8E6660
MTYTALFLAIFLEVVATTFLHKSQQFTQLLPSVITVVGYACSFYLLTIVMKSMPVGIVYAIWGGLGVVLIGLAGVVVLDQKLDAAAWVGMGFIVTGVLIVNLFSASTHS